MSFSCQRYWVRPTDGCVRTRPVSLLNDATREAVAALERHALIDVDGDQLAMHQLMAEAVQAELRDKAPGSHPGVRDLQALLTARYGSEEEEAVDADDFAVMRLMGEAAEYAVAKVAAAKGDADMAMQRWGCGMYLRLASVQCHVTSDAGNIERLLVAASGCLQRMRSSGCTGLNDVTWRLRLYEGFVPLIRGDYDVALALLQALEVFQGKADGCDT